MDASYCDVIILVMTVLAGSTAERIHVASGDVGRGNFTYYSLMYTGFISLELTSTSGDCDLYISQHIPKPTYEADSYCLQSATCGLDSITIPKSFKRPVGIGVFGHPSYETCSYILQVYRINELPDPEDITDDLSLESPADHQERLTDGRTDKRSRADDDKESFIWALFWSFVEFLIEVLFF